MTAYLSAILAAGGVYAVLLAISPEKEEIRKTVSFVLSLAMLFLVLSPLFTKSADGSLFDIFDEIEKEENGDAGKDYLEKETRDAYLRGVTAAICEEFRVEEKDIALSPVFGEGITLLSLTVTLSGNAVYCDLLRLEEFGRENFCESFEVMLFVG